MQNNIKPDRFNTKDAKQTQTYLESMQHRQPVKKLEETYEESYSLWSKKTCKSHTDLHNVHKYIQTCICTTHEQINTLQDL